MASRTSTRIFETSQFRNHLWSEAVTYQGALLVEVSAMASRWAAA
jgi:hypothetical protein